jgi:hypothetical protein
MIRAPVLHACAVSPPVRPGGHTFQEGGGQECRDCEC